MPGLFGAVGLDAGWLGSAVEGVSRGTRGRVQTVRLPGAIVAHAETCGTTCAIAPAPGGAVGVHGEAGTCARVRRSEGASLATIQGDRLEVDARCRGTLAVIDAGRRRAWLAADWASPFPLYYAQAGPGLIFSSHLLPLARHLGATCDPVGVYEFARLNWTLAGRTVFRGIAQVLPGQVVSVDLDTSTVRAADASRLWAAGPSAEEASLDQLWDTLVAAVRHGDLGDAEALGVMLSGGWDSRILLAAAIAAYGPGRVRTFSHGQLDNFELRLAERLARSAGVRHTGVALGPDAFGDVGWRARLLDESETLIYPYWRHTAARMAEAGVGTLTCGVLGEVLGGHYTMMGSRRARFEHFVARRVGRAAPPDQAPWGRLEGLLAATTVWKPLWYVRPEVQATWRAEVEAGVRADAAAVLARYRARGVADPDLFVEAYVTEHRALQMIAKQPLAASGVVQLVLPFCDRAMLLAAARVPLSLRLHNGASRELLRRHAPALLRLPLAATEVPARAPILLHEVGRLVRRGLDVVSDAAFMRSRGRLWRSRPFGWMNFEQTLRDGLVLEELAGALRWDGFDSQAIERRLSKVRAYESHLKLGQQWMKMVYLDRLMTLHA